MIYRKTMLMVGAAIVLGVFACGGDETTTPGNDLPIGDGTRDQANVQAGQEAVRKRKCQDCHTKNQGTMAGSTEALLDKNDPRVKLYPPNLTPDIETGLGDPNDPDLGKRGHTDESLATAIRSGFDRDNLQLCPQMKHDANMTDYEVYSIIKYLRSLPPVKNKVPRSVCPPLKNETP